MNLPGSDAAELAVRDMDPDDFAAFGALADAPDGGGRLPIPTRLANAARGEPTLGLITVQPIRFGRTAWLTLERHPFSVQVFIPLGREPLVAVVAPRELERPGASDLRAFRARPGQAVIFREGTWHLGMACDGAPMSVAVFIHRLEDGSDTETRELDRDVRLIRDMQHD